MYILREGPRSINIAVNGCVVRRSEEEEDDDDEDDDGRDTSKQTDK